MAFFEKIGEKISTAGKDVAKKTRDMTEIAKLNSQINKAEDKIKGTYLQIGKLYYEIFPNSDDERFVPLCAAITETLTEISNCKSQIEAIKCIKKCPKCGAEVDENSLFCSICGGKIEEVIEVQPNTPEEPKCPSCGMAITEGMAFCTNCGGKLQ